MCAIISLNGAVRDFGELFCFVLSFNEFQWLCSPQNKEELFNLRHAQLRNVVERIFGVVKRRFRILTHAPEFSLELQARLPAALSALHNFIVVHDPADNEHDDIEDPDPGRHLGELAEGPADRAERERTSQRRDEIASQMWIDYQQVLRSRQADETL